MNTVKICELLSSLNENKPSEYEEDLHKLLEINVRSINDQLEAVSIQMNLLENPIDNFLNLNVTLLKRLKSLLIDSSDTQDSMLSVQQNKIIRDTFKELITIGIRFNLQPKLPQRLKPSPMYILEEKTITTDYNRMCFTTKSLIELLECDVLRPLIVFVGFESILNALYQIVYCPLKKPHTKIVNSDTHKQENIITEELYQSFVNDKDEFQVLLDKCSTFIPISILVKETMLLLKTDCVWFKKAVSLNLTKMLRSKNGLKTIIQALLENARDYDPSDTSKSWKALDVVVKLIASLKNSPDFESNICEQVKSLLDLNISISPSSSTSNSYESHEASALGPYESIFVSCTKLFYATDIELCRRQFLPLLLKSLNRFVADGKHKFENNDDVTDPVQRTMRLLKLVFFNNDLNEADLPYSELTPYIVVIFRFYTTISHYSKTNQGVDMLSTVITEILIGYLRKQMHYENKVRLSETFDALVFGFDANSKKTDDRCKKFRSDFALKLSNGKITISKDPQDITASNDISFLAHALLKLLKTRGRRHLEIKFFLYLLNCLMHKENYFSGDAHTAIEKNLLIYNLLSSLAEDKNVQEHIRDDPKEIVEYIAVVLRSTIERNAHKQHAECETTFLLIMILQALTATRKKQPTDVYATVLTPLRIIEDECINEELSALALSVIKALESDDGADNVTDKSEEGGMRPDGTKSELDKAIDDVCDALLPIRGHGLMVLTKLIERKDPEALERKFFVLNIFQQNVKNPDSFIYLSAINGLSIMGDLFPELVLETLTEEYMGFVASTSITGGGNDAVEIRMKLGEVLVRVSRNLGERAPKYKSLLLNTFMFGCKDEDHLMRASSLSNLGEICRVIGYKLGSIVTEVLDCIHAVIMTDPAVEARRAAVTVIRDLFVGLESETISFLKDDILDVYRTLKHIYYKDEDDVMRLQAQLALEELNVNVKAFLFSNLSLSAQNVGEINQ